MYKSMCNKTNIMKNVYKIQRVTNVGQLVAAQQKTEETPLSRKASTWAAEMSGKILSKITTA